MKPIIRHEKGRIAVFCSSCYEKVFERDDAPLVELSSYLAFRLHFDDYSQRSSYAESEMDHFMKKIFELTINGIDKT